MSHITLITGQAGSGKTTELLKHARSHQESLGAQQQILAMAVMHGARRRLQDNLRKECPDLPCSVSTIDSFALALVNRWKASLGLRKPIVVSDSLDPELAEGEVFTEATFKTIMKLAIQLTRSPTVMKTVAGAYPVILVDEFQDCQGLKLELITDLGQHSKLLLAADEFQVLDRALQGCPATEWCQGQERDGRATILDLKVQRRTEVNHLLEGATCLRQNRRSKTSTVPVITCPNYGPAAFEILKRLVWGVGGPRWSGGTCCLLSPSRDPVVFKILKSIDNQASRRNMRPVRWLRDLQEEGSKKRLLGDLGIDEGQSKAATNEWDRDQVKETSEALHVCRAVERFAKLRGIRPVTIQLVRRFAEKYTHSKQFHIRSDMARTVTTIHGAKNREFDYVFIIWPYKIAPGEDYQRRLLYNAITRARKDSVILMIGKHQRATSDPALSLLGPPTAAFGKRSN